MNKTEALLAITILTVTALMAQQPKSAEPSPLRQPLTGWQTWTSSGERTLPDTPAPAGRDRTAVAAVSARGASAAVTFALRSSAAIASATLSVEGLDGIAGDLRLVKCWYQDGNAWYAMLRAPGEPILVPELLLHDDSLVKSAAETKSNLLRTSAAGEPPRYEPPSASIVVADDAPALLPFPFAANETREFHLRLEIPATAKPGLFHGRIAVKGDGADLGHLNLDLRVIEHVLPEATGRFLGNRYNDGKKVFPGSSPAAVAGDVYEPFAPVASLPRERLTREACALLASAGVTPVFPPDLVDDVKALAGATPPKALWLADGLVAPDDGPAPDAAALAATAKKARGAGFADTRLFVRSSADPSPARCATASRPKTRTAARK